MVKHVNIDKIYFYTTVVVLTCLALVNTYSNSHNIYNDNLSLILGVSFFILALINFLINGIEIKEILFIISIFIIWGITKFNTFFTVPLLISLAFIKFSPWNVIKGYYLSNLYCLIITFMFAVLGISPMRNVADGVISFGFANENTFGLFTLLISLYYLLEFIIYKNKVHFFYVKILFILFFVIVNYFVTNDKTVILTFILFLIFAYIFKSHNRFMIRIIKCTGYICPLLLTYVSWIISKNYNINSDFFNKLNNLLSNRLYMWNWYYYKIPISMYQNNLKINQFRFWGTIDGSYTYLLFQSGLITTIIVCIILSYCNYLLSKYNYNYILCLLIVLEIGAFSEDILQFPTIVLVMTFSVLSLHSGWLNNKTDNQFIKRL